MRRILFLLTVYVIADCFSSEKIYSQEVPVFESPVMPYADAGTDFIGTDGEFVYLSKMIKMGGVKLNLFVEKRKASDMSLLFSKELVDYHKFQEKVRRSNAEIRCFWVNDKVYAFYQYIDNESDIMYVMVQTVSGDGEISEVFNVLQVPTKNPWMSPVIEFSPDKKSFLVCANANSTYIGNPDFIGDFNVKVYKTATLEPVREASLYKYFTNETYKPVVFKLDNKGDIYFLLEEKKMQSQTTILSVLTISSPTLKQFPSLISDFSRCEGSTLAFNADDDLIFAGVGANMGKDGKGFYADPAVFFRVLSTEDLSVKINKEYSLSKDVMDKLSIGRPGKNSPDALNSAYNYFSNPIIEETSGEYFVVTNDVFYDRVSFKEHSKDIVFLRIQKDGELKSMGLVPRFDLGVYKMLRVRTVRVGNEVYLLYGEHPELANLKVGDYESATMAQMEENIGNVVLTELAENGSVTKKVLFENSKKQPAYYNNQYEMERVLTIGNTILFVLDDTKANSVKYTAFKIK